MKKIFLLLFIILNFCCNLQAFGETPSDLKQQIIVLYNANKLKEAYQLISNIPEDQRDGEIWLLAANITQDYGRNLDAVFLLRKAISIDATNYKYYYNLANIYLSENKYNTAVSNYKLCLKYNKEFAFAWNNMGLAYLGLDEYKKAKNAFMRAISYKNNNADFYYNLAYTYKKLKNKKQSEKMLEIYNRLTEEN